MRTAVRALGALAAALLVLSLGTTGSSAMVPPDQGGAEAAPAPFGDEHAAAVDAQQVRDQVDAVRDATRRYHRPPRARDAGYGTLRDQDGIACIAMAGMGGMGVHLVNGDLVGSPRVQLRKPEALVYARTHGRLRLVALEYVVLRKDWEKVHGRDARPPRLFGERFGLTPHGNRFGLPAFYSLHAWVWKHNPAGQFAPFNPNVECCHCSR